MAKLIDLTGQKFGRYTVIGRGYREDGQAKWECLCECGNVRLVDGRELRYGKAKSCGCLRKEIMRESHTIHGGKYTRLYVIWNGMRERCTNPKNEKFPRYGGRGIKVCDEWNNFSEFEKWAMSSGYSENLTIDRIDNDRDYEPSNCRWATAIEQSNNRSTNVYYTVDGRTDTLANLARLYNAKYKKVNDRLKLGWDIKRALTQ